MQNKQEHRRLSKVDAHGEYALFPGVTVVSACYPEHKEFCETIHKALKNNPLIMQHFSPLPANSYHMTTMSLETEQQVGGIWEQFITNNLSHYKKIKQALQKTPITPSIEKMEVNIGRTISLAVNLPREHVIQIEEIAKALSIEETIPKIFHITLAYSRSNKISIEISEQLKAEITRELNQILEKTILPIKIAEAKLCYFNDMKAFLPWDAEHNPFTQSKQHVAVYMQVNEESTEEFQKEALHETSFST
ncbi:DUF1868 domain-containing protein [Legionella sp. PATHC038]|uniref:DUF1868 domain-containing protein n=1 Tax=Legionella sheltonii TaxID=2992041 RepID=UPI002243AFD5|nr:DUF1868 domain-containing protein [Legionella sp. PATHC038]MCW8400352.1 DUF1868 domain-containing protein [Legionella sp. PATHC038]